MTSQERKNEILTTIQTMFPLAYVRQTYCGFRVYLVPKIACSNQIIQNCPAQIDIDFVDNTDKLCIKAQIDVQPSNPIFFCENVAKKHKLNKTIHTNKPFAPYLQLFATALQIEGTNIIGNAANEYAKYFTLH